MSDQKKFVNYSPVGTFKFPRLNKPDEFKGNSFFKTTVVLDPEDDAVIEFMDKLDSHVFKDMKKTDYKPIKINEEGQIELVVKRKAAFGPPRFFVPTGEKSSEEIEKAPGLIWGGTTGSVSFTSYKYEGGVTFAMTGVTIHDLVEPAPREEAKEEKKPSSKGKKSAKDIFNK